MPRIIVVDDSRVIRRAISKILGAEFDVIEAEDGESGWERLLEDESIQVVVADVEMPRLDGYSLICRIRAAEPPRIKNIPVIIITGAQDEETRQRAFACGATDFITKPIDRVQMLARARAQGLEAKQRLAVNDSHGFFTALGDLVVTGPTRTNVNDYRAILVR